MPSNPNQNPSQQTPGQGQYDPKKGQQDQAGKFDPKKGTQGSDDKDQNNLNDRNKKSGTY